MHAIAKLLHQRVAEGLSRRSITLCSQWAAKYRIMPPPFPGPVKYTYHPWTRDMRDCDAEDMVGQKAAQMGYTEVAIDKCFFALDIKGVNVLYILPASKPDASDFSTSRFDPALELSPHLQNMFSDTKNIGHKRAGSANLFIRGSRSRSQLKSIPAALVIADELEEMDQKNMTLIPERMSGQREKQFFKLSTPSIENVGINVHFKRSTQDAFCFKCPCCSKFTRLIFPDCLVVTAEELTDPAVLDSHIICKECKGRLEHQDKYIFLEKGIWVPDYPGRTSRGFGISQLYSSTVRPDELAIGYLKAQINPLDEQEFYNSKLGLPHEVEGARVTLGDVEGAVATYTMGYREGLTTMGVDVGKWIHVTIDLWKFDATTRSIDLNLTAVCYTLKVIKVLNFEELDLLMHEFRVNYCVIDANPETRKAKEFADRFFGRVSLCYYGNKVAGKSIRVTENESSSGYVTVGRTSWMDLSLGRFKRKKIFLPRDTPLDYKQQVQAPVRIYKKDSDGNPVGRYVKGENDQDHYAHARTYSEIALPLAASRSRSEPIRGIL